jgi:hypothetical protein
MSLNRLPGRARSTDPLSSCPLPLGRSLDGPSEKGIKLFGVAEFLAMEDLEFPVLLDKSVGVGSIVVPKTVENTIVACVVVTCYDVMVVHLVEGQTRKSTFPSTSVTSGLTAWELWTSA